MMVVVSPCGTVQIYMGLQKVSYFVEDVSSEVTLVSCFGASTVSDLEVITVSEFSVLEIPTFSVFEETGTRWAS